MCFCAPSAATVVLLLCRSSAGSLAMSDCTLKLPQPEAVELKRQAVDGQGHIIIKLSGQCNVRAMVSFSQVAWFSA